MRLIAYKKDWFGKIVYVREVVYKSRIGEFSSARFSRTYRNACSITEEERTLLKKKYPDIVFQVERDL